MNMDMLRDVIVMLALVALIGASSAIALDAFASDTTTNSYAYNITQNGLKGVDNASDFFDTC